jgi:hypothetical protein
MLSLACATLAACRSENWRLAALGPTGICPRIDPATPTCAPDTRWMLPKRPLRKSAAPTAEMPLATRAFL